MSDRNPFRDQTKRSMVDYLKKSLDELIDTIHGLARENLQLTDSHARLTREKAALLEACKQARAALEDEKHAYLVYGGGPRDPAERAGLCENTEIAIRRLESVIASVKGGGGDE